MVTCPACDGPLTAEPTVPGLGVCRWCGAVLVAGTDTVRLLTDAEALEMAPNRLGGRLLDAAKQFQKRVRMFGAARRN